ncbi:MAG TPA: hypothetical protein VF618_25105 [Thermoanaerobaculia bacterium]
MKVPPPGRRAGCSGTLSGYYDMDLIDRIHTAVTPLPKWLTGMVKQLEPF